MAARESEREHLLAKIKPFKTERSLVPDLDNGPGFTGTMDPPVDGIMQIYMTALVETYSDNLMVLLDELNKFPGAEIIAVRPILPKI